MRQKFRESGSVLLLALFFTAILVVAGGITFAVIQNRYRQVHQTASWQEALLASEAGIDIAVNEIRKNLRPGEVPWKDWSNEANMDDTTTPNPAAGQVFYTSKVLVRQGEGGQRSYSKIIVDAPAFLKNKDGEQWYRVRSLGVAEVPGGAIAAGEKLDLRLRKFDLQNDRRTGEAVEYPQATRLIEAIVKPIGTFRLALFGIATINMNNHNIVVDSYDSRDPEKSTNGFYDPAKQGENGDIATNGNLIDAGSAHIYGDAATNGGTVLDSTNVSGEIRNDFYQEVFEVSRPDVIADPETPTTVNGSTDITAKAGDPLQVKLDKIKMAGSDVLHIKGAADGSATYIQIIVDGDIQMSGQSQIVLDPGVHLRLFVAGDADITGKGVQNPNSPLHLQVYGLDRAENPDGSPVDPGEMKIAGNGGFRGTVYAPSYDVTMVGGGNEDSIYGSFVAWTIRMTGVQSVHYDEALADGGLVSDYKVASWFEDAR